MSRFFAVLLVALVSSPVTAPFSTCDLAALIGGASDHDNTGTVPSPHEKVVSSAPGSLLPTLSTFRSRTRVLTNVTLRLSVKPSAAAAARDESSRANRAAPGAPRVTNLRL